MFYLLHNLTKSIRLKLLYIFISFFLCSFSIANPFYLIDTGAPNTNTSLALIPPTVFIFGSDDVKTNEQSIAIQFRLNNDYLINEVESYFSISQSGYLRASIFDNINEQPGTSLLSKSIFVSEAGWQGINEINLSLTEAMYWVVFDYDPYDYRTRFAGGLNYFYNGDDVITKVKSNFSDIFSDGLALSSGLRVSAQEISPVPLPSGIIFFASGLILLIVSRRSIPRFKAFRQEPEINGVRHD